MRTRDVSPFEGIHYVEPTKTIAKERLPTTIQTERMNKIMGLTKQKELERSSGSPIASLTPRPLASGGPLGSDRSYGKYSAISGVRPK